MVFGQKFNTGKTDIIGKSTSDEQNGANFSTIALSSEELGVRREI